LKKSEILIFVINQNKKSEFKFLKNQNIFHFSSSK